MLTARCKGVKLKEFNSVFSKAGRWLAWLLAFASDVCWTRIWRGEAGGKNGMIKCAAFLIGREKGGGGSWGWRWGVTVNRSRNSIWKGKEGGARMQQQNEAVTAEPIKDWRRGKDGQLPSFGVGHYQRSFRWLTTFIRPFIVVSLHANNEETLQFPNVPRTSLRCFSSSGHTAWELSVPRPSAVFIWDPRFTQFEDFFSAKGTVCLFKDNHHFSESVSHPASEYVPS